jgi:hypothetical protein
MLAGFSSFTDQNPVCEKPVAAVKAVIANSKTFFICLNLMNEEDLFFNGSGTMLTLFCSALCRYN